MKKEIEYENPIGGPVTRMVKVQKDEHHKTSFRMFPYYEYIEITQNGNTVYIDRSLYETMGEKYFNLPLCDACGKPITEKQRNVGYECDLHEKCAVGE